MEGIKGANEFNLKIEVIRNSDGMIAELFENHVYDEVYEFLWDEGNYSCDCNRHQFFSEALEIAESDIECGDDKYYVRITDNKNGNILYDELN